MMQQNAESKPRPTGSASPLVRASNGGDTDPRYFYVTSYGSSFNATNTMQTPRERLLNKSFRWDQPTLRNTPNCTGYKKNLLPHFDYDKAVDENSVFRIENAFETTQTHEFRGRQPEVPMGNKNVVSHIPDWRLQKPVLTSHMVKLTENATDLTSTQKADYIDPMWFYDAKHESLRAIGVIDGPGTKRHASASSPRLTGLGENESGWVRDRVHDIAGLSDRLPFPDRQVRIESPPLRNVSQVGATGFNHSDAKIPEQDMEMPDGLISHSSATHRPPRMREHGSRQTTEALKKEAAGAVKDWPKQALLSALSDSRWDTSYTTCYGSRSASGTAAAVNNSSNRSGYVMCNKFGFESLHPNIEMANHSGTLLERVNQRKDRTLYQRVGQPGFQQ